MSRALDQYFFQKASLGLIRGCTRVQLRGHNAAITTSNETLWPTSTRYAQVTTAVTFEVISSDANDAAAGTGARTVSIELVDGNHAISTVTATLNGTTAVSLGVGTYIACNKITVLTVGSGGVNAGIITVRTEAADVAKCSMTIGANISDSFLYTTPASSSSLLVKASLTANAAVTVPLSFSIFAFDSTGVGLLIGKQASATTVPQFPIELGFGAGILIPEKTLIEGAATSGGASDVFALGELFVFDGATEIWGL